MVKKNRPTRRSRTNRRARRARTTRTTRRMKVGGIRKYIYNDAGQNEIAEQMRKDPRGYTEPFIHNFLSEVIGLPGIDYSYTIVDDPPEVATSNRPIMSTR